ncbi:hypothetical protein ACMX2M_23715 [Paenibacillus polymyxa]
MPLVEQCFYDLLEKTTLIGEFDFDPEKYITNLVAMVNEDVNVISKDLTETIESDEYELRAVELNIDCFFSSLIRDFSLINFISMFPLQTSQDELEQSIQLHVEINNFLESAKSLFYKY